MHPLIEPALKDANPVQSEGGEDSVGTHKWLDDTDLNRAHRIR
jgi:hypothetical protein